MSNRNWVVGVFVVAGLVLFTIGLYMVGDRHQAFAKHMEYYVEFRDLDGLSQGAKVRVGGMDAGEVVAIDVPDSPAMRFRVKLRIDEKMRALVRADSIATIGTDGIVGETFVQVRPGTSGALAAPQFATLPSTEPLNVLDFLNQGSSLMAEADESLKGLKELTGNLNGMNGKMNVALDAATTTLFNVNDVVIGLKQGHGTAGMLLQDEVAADNIRQAIAQTKEATANLNRVSAQAHSLISDLQSRQLPQQIDDTMHSMKSAAANIDDSTKQIHHTIAEVSEEDEQGMSAGANIRESLSNTNTATANLAAETEALKHNFLVRGFFRRRGYYDLVHLSPDTYRKDKLFINPEDNRVWIPASGLFEKTADGKEVISLAGQRLLSTWLAGSGDAALGQPIVVEGYSNVTDVADQLTYSRHRAILVRQYLYTHFQIDETNVGAVSMRNSPPPGVGHTIWDGICLVLVRRRS